MKSMNTEKSKGIIIQYWGKNYQKSKEKIIVIQKSYWLLICSS